MTTPVPSSTEHSWLAWCCGCRAGRCPSPRASTRPAPLAAAVGGYGVPCSARPSTGVLEAQGRRRTPLPFVYPCRGAAGSARALRPLALPTHRPGLRRPPGGGPSKAGSPHQYSTGRHCAGRCDGRGAQRSPTRCRRSRRSATTRSARPPSPAHGPHSSARELRPRGLGADPVRVGVRASALDVRLHAAAGMDRPRGPASTWSTTFFQAAIEADSWHTMRARRVSVPTYAVTPTFAAWAGSWRGSSGAGDHRETPRPSPPWPRGGGPVAAHLVGHPRWQFAQLTVPASQPDPRPDCGPSCRDGVADRFRNPGQPGIPTADEPHHQPGRAEEQQQDQQRADVAGQQVVVVVADLVEGLVVGALAEGEVGDDLRGVGQPLLAGGEVRRGGQPVAQGRGRDWAGSTSAGEPQVGPGRSLGRRVGAQHPMARRARRPSAAAATRPRPTSASGRPRFAGEGHRDRRQVAREGAVASSWIATKFHVSVT